MAHNLFETVINSNLKFHTIGYYVFGHTIPFILAIMQMYPISRPIVGYAYGSTDLMAQTNCFFNSIIYLTLCFYVPIAIMFIYNITLITMTIYQLKYRLCINRLNNDVTVHKLIIYPGILFICWVLPALLGLIPAVKQSTIYPCFTYLIQSLVGFLDSIAYCYLVLSDYIRVNCFQFDIEQLSIDRELSRLII